MSLCLKCYFDSLCVYVILFNMIIKPFCMYTLNDTLAEDWTIVSIYLVVAIEKVYISIAETIKELLFSVIILQKLIQSENDSIS